MKYKWHVPARFREPLLQPVALNLTRSMNFIHDGLSSGQKTGSFNNIDGFNREAIIIASVFYQTFRR